jgi:hypothetical protein
MRRSYQFVALVLFTALLVAGCADDGDSSAPTTAAVSADTTAGAPEGGEQTEFCALAAELNTGDFPTVDQLNAYRDLAPDEIQDQVSIVVPAFIAAIEADEPQSVFADNEVTAALDEISAFEIETCGPDVAGDGEDAATGPVDPEFAEWCAVALRIDDAALLDEELLADAEATAPDEIRADVDVVVAAFRDGNAQGDPGLGFVRESYEHIVVINSFNDEHCGIPQDPGDFQDPAITEPDPSAAQVAVSAKEMAFEFEPPDAGPTTFTMTNDGALAHVMAVLQAAEGVTAEEAFGSEDPEAVAAFYGSYVARPGEQAVLTFEVEPGEYMMFCYLPTTEGVPHLALGMMQPFTVG